MSKKVLLVEDSRTQALRFQLELLRYGLAVEIIADGSEGLAAAQRFHPDAIVLDVDLPGMDGYSLCRVLKHDPSTRDIPVLMLSYCDDESDLEAGREVGAEDFISKDTSAERNLLAALRKLGLI
jgi:CheY-like chemotaxis protein